MIMMIKWNNTTTIKGKQKDLKDKGNTVKLREERTVRRTEDINNKEWSKKEVMKNIIEERERKTASNDPVVP